MNENKITIVHTGVVRKGKTIYLKMKGQVMEDGQQANNLYLVGKVPMCYNKLIIFLFK